MHRAGAIVFSLLLLCPLVAAPRLGYDTLRLPAALILLAALLAISAFRAARRGEVESRRDVIFAAACVLSGIHAVSWLLRGPALEGAVPLLTLFCGMAAYRIARQGPLYAGWARSTAPWILAALGGVVSIVGLVLRLYGHPAVAMEGNTNYSGALAAILLPALIGFAHRRTDAWKRIIMVGAAVYVFAMLVVTESRGGWVGAVAGTGITVGVLLWRRIPGALRLGVPALAVLIVVPIVLQGARQTSPGRRESVDVRKEMWSSALRMIGDRPFLGTGPGRFAVEYPLYRSLDEFRLSHKHVGADFKEAEDAHSIWVHTAVETGIPGLLALILVGVVFARQAGFALKTSQDADLTALLAGFGGGAVAYLTVGLFNTLTLHLSHTLLFWTFLGLLDREGFPPQRKPADPRSMALPAAASIAAVFAAGLAILLARADAAFRGAMGETDPMARAARLERAREGPVPAWLVSYELGRAWDKAGRLAESASAYRAAVNRRPHHAAALNNLGTVIVRSGGSRDEAMRWFIRTTEVAPYYFMGWYNRGSLESMNGRYGDAAVCHAKALELNPMHAGAWYSLGEARLLEGNPAGAVGPFRKARELGLAVGAVLRRDHPSRTGDPALAEFFQ